MFGFRRFSTLLIASSILATGLLACSPDRTSVNSIAVSGIIGGTFPATNDPISKSTVYIGILDRDTHAFSVCTGSLLTPNLVITAAHCLTDLNNGQVLSSPFEVLLDFKTSVTAQDLLDSGDAGYNIDFSEIVAHPGFKPKNGVVNMKAKVDDLALIHLSTPAPASAKPARILTNVSVLKIGAAVKLAGFGPPNGVSAFPFALRSVDSLIVDALNPITGELQTQNLLSPVKKGITHGDSGGPAYVAVKGVNYLFGVCSNGGVNDNNAITEFESIPANMNWIRSSAKTFGVALP